MDKTESLNIKVVNGKCRTTFKSYIVLFICLTTKVLHLEIVNGLTTDQFIAALSRFISRRGYPYRIYSDNDINFFGINNRLHHLYQLLRLTVFQDNYYTYYSIL